MNKWAIVIIILLVLGVWVYGNDLLSKDKFSNLNVFENNKILSHEEEAVKKCKKDVSIYSDVREKKTGGSVSLNEIKYFNNLEDAKDFIKVWGDSEYGYKKIDSLEEDIILVSVTINLPHVGYRGSHVPMVLKCNKEGILDEFSINQLT